MAAMGTSKSYQAPTNPQWAEYKKEVTRVSRNGAIPAIVAKSVLNNYIQTNGGAGAVARGGGTIGGSRASQKVGGRIGGFARSVATQGLDEALHDVGLSELVGKPAGEIALALIDKLSDDGSTLDEVDARNAVSDLITELLAEAETYEQVTEKLEEKLQLVSIDNLLIRFFGYYLYRQFCRLFYERLVARHGEDKTNHFLDSIRDFIVSELKFETFGRDLTKVDWSGGEGNSISDEVLERTLKVFGE
jgi:hypothetical protein